MVEVVTENDGTLALAICYQVLCINIAYRFAWRKISVLNVILKLWGYKI